MRRLMLLTAVLVAGCGGGGSRSADETARAWVDAINAEDWERACELSVKVDEQECVGLVADGFRDAEGAMRIEGSYRSGDTTTFAIAMPRRRDRDGEVGGWTGYGPGEVAVERHDGEYLVHFEVTSIR